MAMQPHGHDLTIPPQREVNPAAIMRRRPGEGRQCHVGKTSAR